MISLIEILNMHGYGVYVYSAYAIVFTALLLHFTKIIKHHKQIKHVLSDKFSDISAHRKHQAHISVHNDMKSI